MTARELKSGMANNAAGTVLSVLLAGLGAKYDDGVIVLAGVVGVIVGLLAVAIGWGKLREVTDE